MDVTNAIFRDTCIIYNTNKDTLAVLCACRNIDIVSAMNAKDSAKSNDLDVLKNRII